MKNTIRWGIIGCGDVTEIKSGPAFNNVDGSQLVAVMRRNAAMAQDYAARHSVPRWYSDADRLINDPEVDAVYIATPPGSHLELALKVCAAGKPAYVEKPMARNYAECEHMVQAFAAAGIPLFTAYYRRALERFKYARGVVNSGRLGTITSIKYRYASKIANLSADALPWRLQAEHAGGGLFLDLGCHTLDIIGYIVGEIVESSGFASRFGGPYLVEDNVCLSFQTVTGACGMGSWNFTADRREDLIEIYGTQGILKISTFGDDPVIVESDNEVGSALLPNPRHIQEPMIAAIVNDLLGKEKAPSTGETGSITSKVMDSALEGYYSGRSDAFWERPETWRK
jgi:1,5-anhydro-D-fructose reductase (1,5-anhydro-D-mannitol-forming)